MIFKNGPKVTAIIWLREEEKAVQLDKVTMEDWKLWTHFSDSSDTACQRTVASVACPG